MRSRIQTGRLFISRAVTEACTRDLSSANYTVDRATKCKLLSLRKRNLDRHVFPDVDHCKYTCLRKPLNFSVSRSGDDFSRSVIPRGPKPMESSRGMVGSVRWVRDKETRPIESKCKCPEAGPAGFKSLARVYRAESVVYFLIKVFRG